VEGFSNGDCVQSPSSSPLDIFWSSSGSSDLEIISRSCAARVVTRLDFDSCVVQSPNACCKFRARVTRNVINVESGNSSLHHPEVSVSEDNRGQMSVDMVDANSVSPKAEVKQEDSALVGCSDRQFSRNFFHNFNETNESEFSLQKSPDCISGTGNGSNVTVSSPIIGRKKLALGERYFHYRNGWRRKRKRKVNDSLLQGVLCQEHTTFPLTGSQRSDRKDSYKLNKETEEELDLKGNVRLSKTDTDLRHTIEENEMPLIAASEQNEISQSSITSPIMKCHKKWHKWKHSVKISHLRKNRLNITKKPDECNVRVNDIWLNEGGTAENKCTQDLILSPSSPILGKDRERRFRKRKLVGRFKSVDCIQNKELQDYCRVSSRKGSLLHGHSIENTPQEKHRQTKFNKVDVITLEDDRKGELDRGLKESHNFRKCDACGVDVEGDCIINEDEKVLKEPKFSEGKTGSVLFMVECLTEACTTAEKQCNRSDDRNVDLPSLEFKNVLNGNVQCGRNLVNMEAHILLPDAQSNISHRRDSVLLQRKEQKFDAEGKEGSPDGTTSSELLIETETSPDISMDSTAVCHRNDLPQVKLLPQENV